MPEFILDYGSTEAVKAFKQLDEFTQGYVKAIFFTETGTGDDEDLEHATVADLDEDAWERIKSDCSRFQSENAALLEEAYSSGYSESRAGNDFWLTRNGHGTGFWDRDELPEHLGKLLSDAAKGYGEVSPYLTDADRMTL